MFRPLQHALDLRAASVLYHQSHLGFSSSSLLEQLISGVQAQFDLPEHKKPKKPLEKRVVSPRLTVPDHIEKPPYVNSRFKPPWGPGELLTDAQELAKMRLACKLAARVLNFGGSLVAPGVTTDEIDRHIHEFTLGLGAYPSALHYSGFPKSVCTSVNEVVCHGIPDARPLEEGDIINIDMVVYKDGYHGDNSRTFAVGQVSPAAQELIEVTREATAAAVAICQPGVPFSTIGQVIQDIADRHKMGVVRDFIGHGVGRLLHCEPKVFHYRNQRADSGVMVPGQTFTIEPQLTLGRPDTALWRDGWTVVTADGSLTAQFEHVVLITEGGHEVLTLDPETATTS